MKSFSTFVREAKSKPEPSDGVGSAKRGMTWSDRLNKMVPVDFDDTTPVDYDGQDRTSNGYLDHNAKKRKGTGLVDHTELSLESVEESIRQRADIKFNPLPAELIKDLGQEFVKQALGFIATDKGFGVLFKTKVSERGVASKLGVDATDVQVMPQNGGWLYHFRDWSVDEQVEVDEAISLQQRQKKKRDMKKYKSRISRGQRKAKSTAANLSKLQRRARRQARTTVLKKILRVGDKSSMSASRKAEVERRMERPANKAKVAKLAQRMLPQQRKRDRAYRGK